MCNNRYHDYHRYNYALPGVASGLIQKDIHDKITISTVGMYVCKMWKSGWRARRKLAFTQVKFVVPEKRNVTIEEDIIADKKVRIVVAVNDDLIK